MFFFYYFKCAPPSPFCYAINTVRLVYTLIAYQGVRLLLVTAAQCKLNFFSLINSYCNFFNFLYWESSPYVKKIVGIFMWMIRWTESITNLMKYHQKLINKTIAKCHKQVLQIASESNIESNVTLLNILWYFLFLIFQYIDLLSYCINII